MTNDVFLQFSLLMVFAAAISLIMRALRQPLIIGYIITGIAIGPSALNLINNAETIDVLGKFGIALLLFIVGLGLNPRVIKELGKVAVIAGVGQVVITSSVGYLILRALGFTSTASIFMAIGLALSSTIVILKLLSDKKEQNKLHGQIAIGILLVQDIIATFGLVFASASGRESLQIADIGILLVKGLGLVLGLTIVSRFVIKPMTTFISRTQELLFLFAIAWGFGVGALFYELNFSLEVGALFAGIALATMPYAQDIGSRLRPLRDFFIVVFFVALGAGLELDNIGALWWKALILSAFVILVKPFVTMVLMGILGYTKKTSFKTSIALAQVSEFSLIFLLLGVVNGQISNHGVTLITLVALITFAISSYMIIYSDKLYALLEPYLHMFERRKTRNEHENTVHYESVIIGFKKGGAEFARSFSKLKKKFLVIDYDPDVIDEVSRRGYDYLYGDVTDLELIGESGIEHAKSIISTVTDIDTTEIIVRNAIKLNPKSLIICSTDSATHAARLYETGATYVMMPHAIGTEKISNFIEKHGLKKSEFKTFRDKHLLYIASYIDELPEKHHQKLGRAVVDKIAELAALSRLP